MPRPASPASLLLACAFLLTAGCSDARPCTLIGARVGLSVHVRAPLAARAESVEMDVCWDGSCRQARTPLHPSSRPGQETCSGDTCAAPAVPTGDENGFGEVQGLPERPVRVRLTLRGAGTEPVLERTIEVTPRGVFPNGPDCGKAGPQAVLTVEGDGTVRSGS
ncbi:hypothetical protein AB0C28_10700 [Nonomuraea sp. NPDC048892]|uniref:hypothetical protein n=1 Tax=Nonomuraea sp. NPDC048892 TaxID=3154624 RepID=UPI0033F1DC68